MAWHARVGRSDGLKRRDIFWMGAEDLVVPLTKLESGKVVRCVIQENSSGDSGGCKKGRVGGCIVGYEIGWVVGRREIADGADGADGE